MVLLSLIRTRCLADILLPGRHLLHRESFGEEFSRLLIADRRQDHTLVPLVPIDRCSHTVLISQLQRVNYPNNLPGKPQSIITISQSPLAGQSHLKFRPVDAGYKIEARNFLFPSTMNTARHVRTIPSFVTSSLSNMFSFTASSLFSSSMIGYGNGESPAHLAYDLMSLIHARCDSALSQDKAIGFTLREVNSGRRLTTSDSSVVQTGVKSAG